MVSSRRLTFANLTQDVLFFSLRHKTKRRLPRTEDVAEVITLAPLVSDGIVIPKNVRRLELQLSTKEESKVNIELELNVKTWGTALTPDDIPWRIYVVREKTDSFKVMTIPKRETSNFLSYIPDEVSLSSVLLPGTHDSMAFYGWPMSQCQSLSTPLMTQLCSGIRLVDIRLSVIKGRLLAYHGIYPQRETFQGILCTLHSFLSSSRETVVVSIKQEDFRETPLQHFSYLVRKEIIDGPGGIDMWFLENRVPNLGEVRGKAIMFSRFGGTGYGWEGGRLGIHPSRWPDGEKYGFTWQCEDTLVRTHDWYNISSFLAIPEKVTLGIRNMILAKEGLWQQERVLPITYFSAASFPLALPAVVACGFGWPEWGLGVEGVNSRLGKWLLMSLEERVKGETMELRGWTLVDFYNEPAHEGLVPLLIEWNFVQT